MNPVYRKSYNPTFPSPYVAGSRFPAGWLRVRPLYPALRPYSLVRRVFFSIPARVGLALFWAVPLLTLPLFNFLAVRLYPRFHILPRLFRGQMTLRPPTGTIFFREMFVLLLAILIGILIQAIIALILRRRGPWVEIMAVGPPLALAAYGVLRGFQVTAADRLFFPLPCLGASLLLWLGISAAILLPYLRRSN